MYGSEEVGYEGAGPLGVVFAAFVSNYFWCKEGWDIEDNPVGTGFEIFWMFFEPLLFGITGILLLSSSFCAAYNESAQISFRFDKFGILCCCLCVF